MKILVTGCCGFIGSHFVDLALEEGHTVVGVDCLAYSGRSLNLAKEQRDQVYLPSITDRDAIRFIMEREAPDALVNFAAESHVARSIESRDAFLSTNIMGTNVLLEESLRYWRGGGELIDQTQLKGTRPFLFLQVSTDEVYGSLGLFDKAWTENSPYAPNNPYAASKASADHLVRAYLQTYGLPCIITHAANNYGSRQHPEKLIPTLIRQALANDWLTLHGDGLHMRDWLHVADHCRGIMAALTRGCPGATYNFGGECERTNRQVAEYIGARFSEQPRIRYIRNRPGNDRRYFMSIDRTVMELNWYPRHLFEKDMPAVIQWYVDNPNYGDEYGR